MKLGKKGKDVESFVDKLVAEGESELHVGMAVMAPLIVCVHVCCVARSN